MYKKIISFTLVAISLSSCSSVNNDDTTVDQSALTPLTSEMAKKYASLKGIPVWVQVNDHSKKSEYCNTLRSYGMLVTCESSKTMTNMVDNNEIVVTCPKISPNITYQLATILKLSNVEHLDLRHTSGYKSGESCSKKSAVFVEILK